MLSETEITGTDSISIEEEKRVTKKVRRRIIPIVFAMYCASVMDRANLANAHVDLATQLKLKESDFGTAVSCFFLGYTLLEIPSNFVVAKWSARKWLSSIIILWGLITSLSMFVNSKTSLYITRFLLGITEAGLFPGIVYYLTFWFESAEQGENVSILMSSIPIGGVLSGFISFIIYYMDGILNVSWWQWFFLIEGLATICVGIVSFLLLPETPEECKWLTEEDKFIILRKCPKERRTHSLHSFSDIKVHLHDTILSWNNLLLAAALWFIIFAEIGVLFYLPKLITDMGVKGFIGNLLTIIPYSITIVIMLLWARRSDKKEKIEQKNPNSNYGYNRYWHIQVPTVVSIIGLASMGISIATKQSILSFICTFLPVAAILTSNSLINATTPYFSKGDRAIAIAYINCVALTSGLVGPYIIGKLRDLSGGDVLGITVMALSIAIASILLYIFKRYFLVQFNKPKQETEILLNE